jgi:hypothetical protein
MIVLVKDGSITFVLKPKTLFSFAVVTLIHKDAHGTHQVFKANNIVPAGPFRGKMHF